jgi:hypothetical protein
VLRRRVMPLAEEENERTFGALKDEERELLHALLLRLTERE